MPTTFLAAEWRNLVMANYDIDPQVLSKYIPANTELDYFEGRCYVSLVGFMFLNTRVLGIPIPFHQNFEEVNLRFYVRYKSTEGWRRGVVFIKEIVPRWAISFVANVLYREPYFTMKMSHKTLDTEGGQLIRYDWGKHYISVEVAADSQPIPIGSEAEFITEHYFGYTRWDAHTTKEYEVQHPRWQVRPVLKCDIECDFGELYGTDFSFLSSQKPYSVLLANGSPIKVMKNVKA
jgi:uncharacterized protein